MKAHTPKQTLLLVANWDSGVGYAWWLMESFWTELARRYHREYRVLLTYPSISEIPTTLRHAPLEITTCDFHAGGAGGIWRQLHFLRRHRVHVIYFSDWPTWCWKYALYRLAGVRRIVVHDHTPGLRTVPPAAKRWAKALAHRLPWVTADTAIGASEFVRQRLIEINRMPERRVFAAPNGLPEGPQNGTEADLHKLFSIPAERKILIMTGRAHPYKGIPFVLECLALLTRQYERRDVHFLFVGDGPALTEFVQKARDLGIGDLCTFSGRRNDVSALLAGAHVAIHPSRGEVGYSLSILEYMRAGLPVLVPDNPSVCGATEDGITGLIYREEDAADATQKILRLVDDEALRKRIGHAARAAAKDYKLERTQAAVLSALEATLARYRA